MSRSELGWLVEAGTVESAVAWDLADDLDAEIRALQVDPDALAPHLTLCFLGRMPGAIWDVLGRDLAALGLPQQLPVRAEGVGVFRRPDGRIHNVHLRVRPDPELLDWHERVLDCGRRQPGFAPGPFTGAGWVPHVSIRDGVDLDRAPDLDLGPRDTVLVRPHLLARRIDPVRARAL